MREPPPLPRIFCSAAESHKRHAHHDQAPQDATQLRFEHATGLVSSLRDDFGTTGGGAHQVKPESPRHAHASQLAHCPLAVDSC